jgi:tRNA(Arg) A34 adenosine deaminase TadA
MTSTDEQYVQKAIEQAKIAEENGDVPVGVRLPLGVFFARGKK